MKPDHFSVQTFSTGWWDDDLAGFELASWTSTTHLSLQDVIEFKGREGGLVIGKCFLQSDELSYNPDDIEIIFEVVAQKVEPN